MELPYGCGGEARVRTRPAPETRRVRRYRAELPPHASSTAEWQGARLADVLRATDTVSTDRGSDGDGDLRQLDAAVADQERGVVMKRPNRPDADAHRVRGDYRDIAAARQQTLAPLRRLHPEAANPR